MTQFKDMLAPDPIQLPAEELPPTITLSVALTHPSSPLVWATIAEDAITAATSDSEKVQAYAFARTGYHRSLDRLRAHGWKGWGPVPFSHTPNQGVLRAIAALGNASLMINDQPEYNRIRQMLSDADPTCVEKLLH
ncbi:Protein of uncharacterised function (DUF3151) [Corynebacterium kutscheri]|uniref:Protein of uncharacterized function (DUF3151) n=1 Tax=Corynebacterium kutscheri TaxID=35755 RepID=A0A0F6TCC5_9CORY|nr:DUF3151 domain-containing protein [Corynebacterium kutscheri]AKE40679.1 Protein of unknown function (DUF3151) [Corynebacterium kutscheri]VEH04718.1 Protein of uncharacterised function (DUF3151) [Corynebacterium kutscheri]VEH11076.1 Protein of uncharacterised function (DUF3151) [Corynebacterium kutscheri]VEH80446.1 Protein of uncharacterised function (DUF3151) [Corynebacterium kutscheri]